MPAADMLPPLRADLVRSQQELLDHLARPGSWFSGAERLAIAAESRRADACALCRARRAALSPEHAHGEHDRATALPDPLVELAHRIRSDPRRLSRPWFERIRSGGVDEGPYVEAVGIVALLAGLDAFCAAIGRAPHPLPSPRAGAPSRHRPAGAREGPGWVATLAPEDAGGPEADLYPKLPMVPNITRALSLVPDHVRVLRQLTQSHYVALEDLTNPAVGRDLDRMQIELVAARVSAKNECFY
jgi:hypothetical protein